MMSRKLLGIVIGGSLGGLFFVFVMMLLFSPGVFLKGTIKEGLSRAFEGRAQAERITFGWKKGIRVSNFILLQKEGDRPALKARKVRLKFDPFSLLRGRYILRKLEVYDLEAVKRLRVNPAMGIGVLELKASHLVFTGEFSVPTTAGLKEMAGGGHVMLEDGLLTGELVSVLMDALGQQGDGYTFKSISTNFEAEKEGQINLRYFLAKGDLLDLELEGVVQADQTLSCNAVVVISTGKVREKAQKFLDFSGMDTLR
ncbi:MAG: hypothetical protein ACK4WF_05745, partial [Candidatus Brocadiales bacterium]